MSTSPISNCTLDNPELCRIHGNRQKIKFDKRATRNLKWAQENLENTGDNVDDYMSAKDILEHAEREYYATIKGEAELEKLIDEAKWPEGEILAEKLRAALEVRKEFEERDKEAYTYRFPESKLDNAQKRIDKANKKLERAGIEERFGISDIEYYTESGENGEEFNMVKITINNPPLNVEGWDFVAAVDEAEAGFVTRVLPGQELKGYTPESMTCEHCGQRRSRKATYLLRDADGNYKQVGSSCLESFLGVTPKGLWTLDYDLEETSRMDDGRRISGGVDSTVELQKVIALSLAVSDNGDSYMSNSRAYEFGERSTATKVKEVLFGRIGGVQESDYSQYMEKANKILIETKFEGNSDYETNMRTVLSGERVRVKHIGYAASVISAYKRQKEANVIKEAKIVSAPKGFIGTKGEKIANVDAVITKVVQWEANYGYNSKTETMIIMRTPDNKEIKWKASGNKDFEEGQKVTITAATVKDHTVYRENDQTVILRAKLNVIEEESVEEKA